MPQDIEDVADPDRVAAEGNADKIRETKEFCEKFMKALRREGDNEAANTLEKLNNGPLRRAGQRGDDDRLDGDSVGGGPDGSDEGGDPGGWGGEGGSDEDKVVLYIYHNGHRVRHLHG